MKSKKIIVLCLFVTSVFFTGCSKDEEKEQSAVRLVSKIKYYQIGSPNEPKSLIKMDNGNSSMLDYTIEYRYDEQNRITKIIRGILTATITYPEKNTMVITLSEPFNEKITYKLNDAGYVTSWSDIFRPKGICVYDDDGYVQRTEGYANYYIPVEFFEAIGYPTAWANESWHGVNAKTYTWEKGNIVTATEQTYSEPVWRTPLVTIIYEYGSVRYIPCNIMDFGHFVFEFSGWYGKPNMNMPSRATVKREDGSEDVATYRYETDRDGYPVRIFLQINNGREALSAVIEYKD